MGNLDAESDIVEFWCEYPEREVPRKAEKLDSETDGVGAAVRNSLGDGGALSNQPSDEVPPAAVDVIPPKAE